MAKIVAIHGIAQQVLGEETLKAQWLPAMRDGLTRAGALPSEHCDLRCAFYGDLFRKPGRPVTKSGDPWWDTSEPASDWERDLMLVWWEEVARVDASVPAAAADGTKARTPRLVQDALYALSHAQFFAGLVERAFLGNLRQVRAYFHDEEVRATAIERLAACITDDTAVMIAHSLGSIVAYEALCAHSEWPVRTFVTLGSPLGIPNLIFHRLRPQPLNGRGAWPGSISRWFNIADLGDVVALRKHLAPLFEGYVEDALVNNDANAHDVRPYLTAIETGRAIAAGLAVNLPE